MNLCYFEINGGKDPKISLTLNRLDRLESDSASSSYTNQILESIERRHNVSCEFFKKFFGECYSNDDRWSMIEDFFLGKSNDEKSSLIKLTSNFFSTTVLKDKEPKANAICTLLL